MNLHDQALSIAIEHVTWARQQGMTAEQILQWADVKPSHHDWDSVTFAIGLAWLGMQKKRSDMRGTA
jgi:hypothetical protein